MSVIKNKFLIVGLGEALFDCFDGKQRPGGAPLNVVGCANQLGKYTKNLIIKVAIASRIGDDNPGNVLKNELKQRNIDISNLQIDSSKPTATVDVFTDDDGEVDYNIASNVGWDSLEYDKNFKSLAKTCSAVCFGTLAQRSLESRETIQAFLKSANDAIRMFDVNLRGNGQTPYYSNEVLNSSLELSSILKLNEQELPVVMNLLGLKDKKNQDVNSAIFSLIDNYNLDMVVLTQGKLGTKLFLKDRSIFRGEKVNYPFSNNADSVGAGDSCAAAVLVGLLARLNVQRIADLANHIGAFVASKPGALPILPDSICQMIEN